MESDGTNHEPSQPDIEGGVRLLKEAAEAGAAGDECRMLTALNRSGLLVGLKRRLMAQSRSRGNKLHPDDADFALAEAVTALYESLRGGKHVANAGAFLLKVADRRAIDRFREMCRSTDPSTLAEHGAQQEQSVIDGLIAKEDHVEDVDSLQKRYHAFRLVRSLLPQLGQTHVQEVMAFIIEAAEAGDEHVADSQIADALGITVDTAKKSRQRGFERLRRLVAEKRYDHLILDYIGRHPDDDVDE